MTEKNELRLQAEAKLVPLPQDIEALSPAALRKVLHELRVHQIELEMQNEELRRTQAELDAARERYFDLYDLAPVGYCTLSEPGLILEANLTAATLLGLPRGALVKQPFSRFIHKEDQDIYYRHRQQLLETGKAQACEFRMLRSDGAVLWTLVGTSVAEDAQANPVWRVVLSDITARKQAEVQRGELQVQLAQSQKLESVGRLAGGVAHEFNNKLMGIMGYAELCRDELPPEHPIRGYLDEITAEARHSADIARQLLAFARKQVITPKVLDLNDAVTNTVTMLRCLLGNGIDLAWLPGAAVWPVMLDPSQLDQILANLAVNAREAIGCQGRLTLETRNVTLDRAACAACADAVPGEYAMLAVSDDGCGVESGALEHLFEPFFTTKEMGEGTGLTLATVYGIVRQNSGFITVTSIPGKGTTFSIHLPRTAAADTAAAPTTSTEPLPCGTETILLAEDEKSVRITTQQFLKALGYTVLVAADPEDALRLAAAHAGEVHLMLADVLMPGLNGLDLAARLKAQRPRLKCLFMSGHAATVSARRGIVDRGERLLAKPFSREHLAIAVRQALDAPATT